jgi:methyltransferase (TIGR00027 family)
MAEPRNAPTPTPESSAVRVALWRARHVEVDAPPHVLEDTVGLRLVAPPDDWRLRGDMDAQGTRRYRASIVVRARFVEDLVLQAVDGGVGQYVILGAGLDTLAQRRPELGARLRIFEIDQPGPQAWKRQRLMELGYGVPDWLHLVPVDFESTMGWWQQLVAAGFRPDQPAVVASTGVSMYLTREANAETLRQLAGLAPSSTLVLSFLQPVDLVEPDEQAAFEAVTRAAAAAGTPFLSFFVPSDLVAMAREAGFKDARYVSADELNARYFAGRTDGLRTINGEELIVATT